MRVLVLALAMSVIAAASPALAWQGDGASSDQVIAQRIADRLTSSGQLKGYSIAVKYKDGQARLEGWVRNQQQLDAAMGLVQDSPEVQDIVNELSIRHEPVVTRAAPGRPQPLETPADMVAMEEGPADDYQGEFQQAAYPGESAKPARRVARQPEAAPAQPLPGQGVPMQGVPMPGQPGMGMQGGPLPAYIPGTGGGVAPSVYDQPYLPGYAWPGYAAYPNYAALTYPRQYSPAAWPYIGPFYPYPQVPLGWRKVTLEWDDGWWMINFSDKRRHVYY